MLLSHLLYAKVEKVFVMKETSKGVLVEKANGEVWNIEISTFIPYSAVGNQAIVKYSIDLDSIGSEILFKGKDDFCKIWGAEKISDTPLSTATYVPRNTVTTKYTDVDLIKIGLLKLEYLKEVDLQNKDSLLSATKKYVENRKLKLSNNAINDILVSLCKDFMTMAQKDSNLLEFSNAFYSAVVATMEANKPQIIQQARGNVIESRIDGDFNGWEGETIVKLQDGSIWQQSSYTYSYSYAYCPNVILFSDGGLIKMKVEGNNSIVTVTRLR